MIDTDHIVLEKDGEVARVWLNRPHKKNAVTVELLHRLDEIIVEVDNDPELKVLVLRGRGNTFCSGFDLDELLADYIGTTTAMDVAVLSAKVCDRLYSMNTPSVAVLEGYVTAGGFELMISCDFAIAADDAMIGDFHIRRALFGGAGPIYRLPRMIGIRKTKELMLTGKLLTGQEAVDFDLINASAPADELDKTRRRVHRAAHRQEPVHDAADQDDDRPRPRRRHPVAHGHGAPRGRQRAAVRGRQGRRPGIPREARAQVGRSLT